MNTTREQRMRDDYRSYLKYGGRHDFATWAERYGDDYPADELDEPESTTPLAPPLPSRLPAPNAPKPPWNR